MRFALCHIGICGCGYDSCPVTTASQVMQNYLFPTHFIPADVGCPFAAWLEQRETRWGSEFASLCGPAVASFFLWKEHTGLSLDLLNCTGMLMFSFCFLSGFFFPWSLKYPKTWWLFIFRGRLHVSELLFLSTVLKLMYLLTVADL